MMSLSRPAQAMCMRARPPARHPEPPIACVSRCMITAHVQLLRYSRHSRAHLSRYLRPNQSQMQLRPPPGSGTPSHARPPFHVLSESPYDTCRTKLSYDIRVRPPTVPHVPGLASWPTLISLACGRTSSRLSPLMAHGCIPCEPRAALGRRIPFPAGPQGPEHDLEPNRTQTRNETFPTPAFDLA